MTTDEMLESDKRIKYLERQLAKKDEELKAYQNEKKVLEDIATVNQMSIRKLDNEREARHVLPEDSLDTIVRLENTTKLEKQKQESLAKQNRTLELQLRNRDKEVDKLNAEIEKILRETGYVRGQAGKQPFRDVKDQENRIGELQLMVQKLEEEQRTNRQIQRKKTQLIETLSKELDGKKNLEEELYQCQNAMKVKDKEQRELLDELKTLKRIQSRKDKLIVSMENEKDDIPIKALEGDKRFLQSEIGKHQEARRQQERTIRAQQFRIEQLETRLDQITTSLKNLNLDKQVGDSAKGKIVPKESAPKDLSDVTQIVPEKEMIDLELYEMLQMDLEKLRNSLSLKEVMLQEKDQSVEALEKKVEILAHAKRAEGRGVLAERKELVYQIEDLKRALDIQQDTYRQQVDRLKADNTRLKKKLREVSGTMQ
eukprot:TRINITY_DN9968_c0_g2_i1.p1 TRINITY_DN9968_c0_g2~~TRINITY_DN9968_c0_g2_i1.p1  ORF type:complete len:427 (-),score=98.42 TRINITY_DN9968_c0_g2_i1:118-1398(-)